SAGELHFDERNPLLDQTTGHDQRIAEIVVPVQLTNFRTFIAVLEGRHLRRPHQVDGLFVHFLMSLTGVTPVRLDEVVLDRGQHLQTRFETLSRITRDLSVLDAPLAIDDKWSMSHS